MRKKINFRRDIAFMRVLLCMFLSLVFVGFLCEAIDQAHHDFPNSPTVKALVYLSPAASFVRAASCTPIPAGSSVASINSALAACNTAGGGTVFAALGAYAVNGNITVPCHVSLSGPVLPYQQTHYQTAVFTGSVTQPFRTTSGCAETAPYPGIRYIEWNGNNQTNGGGGIYLVAGTNGFEVDHNYMHGAGNSSSSAYPGCCGEVQVYLGDNYSSTLTQNIQIVLNEFGTETNGNDCGPAMTALSTSSGGGFCNGVGSSGQLKNILIDQNIFHNLEQGAKVAEACNSNNGHGCQPGTGDNPPSNGNTQLYYMTHNWFYNIQRIPFETQSNYYNTATPTTQYIEYNVLGNRNAGGGGQQNFDLSIANGCGNPPATPNCTAMIIGNANVQNVSVPGAGFEFWGDSNSVGNYNLTEGYPAPAGGAFDYAQSGQFNFVGNIFNMVHGGSNTSCTRANAHGGFWNNEDSPAADPTCSTGNTYSTTGTGTYTSVLPTIAISGANWTVTFPTATNLYLNTNAWCTIDGSAPGVASGTSAFYAAGAGGPTSAVTGGAIKCIGMWGTINQPHSYPTNYGFVPSAVVTQAVTTGTNYFMSPTGSDSNNGLSAGAPWLSPNHSVNCGDVITAASGTYSSSNFYNGKWGTVTCPAANNVAWVKCAAFDTCFIHATSQQGMYISSSFWGVQGWEITDTWTFGNCYYIQPTGSTAVHHIIWANDIANACAGGGFVAFASTSTPAVDYLAVLGDVAYGTSSANSVCASGFSLGFLPQLDNAAGTHLYVAGNFAWNNFDPATCAGAPATDGEGMIFDTLKQFTFTGQAVAANNIFVGNGGRGLEVNNNNLSTPAPIVFVNNTMYGNNLQAGQDFPNGNAEMDMQSNSVTATKNIAMTSQGTTGGSAIYAATFAGTGTVAGNLFYSAAGNTTFGSGFGTNSTTVNPAFANPVIPGAPACSGTANTVACMSTLIANFKATAPAAAGLGYQQPSTTSVTDQYYPQWLCGVTNMPSGLVTPGCGGTPSPTLTSGYQGNGATACTSGGANTQTVGGAAIQQVACGNYSSGTTPIAFNTTTNQDPYGNTITWSSSAPTIGNVSSTGQITCLTSGTFSSLATANPGNITFNQWVWTCSGSTPAATPVITPATGTFTSSQSVTMTDTTPGSSIYYTTNGTTPNTGSTLYTGAFPVVVTSTVQAIAAASGYTNSAVATSVITISPAPTISSVTLQIASGKPINYIPVGGTVQFVANVHYSDGTTLQSTIVGVPNPRGDAITAWNTSASGIVSITNQGIATGIALGVANPNAATITAVVNGSLVGTWIEYTSKNIVDEMTGEKFRGGVFLSALPRLRTSW